MDDIDNHRTKTVQKPYKRSALTVLVRDEGAASSSECPRGGYIWLRRLQGPPIVMKTTCKVWSCKGCRNRTLNMVKMRISYGVALLRPSWFITLTLRKRPEASTKDATYVADVWGRFWRLYRKKNPGKITPWFRVIELTKKKQPHLHLVVGGLGTNRLAIEREWAFLWLRATRGESYIVWATEVYGPNGAAGYLTKYMVKMFQHRKELVERGFHRRWSRSRNWPGSTIKTLGTLLEAWTRVDWISKHHPMVEEARLQEDFSRNDPLTNRVGDEMALAMEHRRRVTALGQAAKQIMKGYRK